MVHRFWLLQRKKRMRACVCQKKVVSLTNSPLLLTGAPSNVTVAACSLYANISELIKRSCTPTLLCLKVHLYASITHTIIHNSTEKTFCFFISSLIFAYIKYLLYLCSRIGEALIKFKKYIQ
jgi:hypothetical protein